jgi:hypothetical protein
MDVVMINDYGTVNRMKIGTGNRSILRKFASVLFCPLQIPLDLTWDRTWESGD